LGRERKEEEGEGEGETGNGRKLTRRYLWGSIKFAVVYLVGGILFLTGAGSGWKIPYFLSILSLPVIFLLTNTLDKVHIPLLPFLLLYSHLSLYRY